MQSYRRNSTQQTKSASPISNRRVSNQLQGSPSITSSNGIHSGLHSRNRPPVPLFANNSPRSINQLPTKPAMSAVDTQGNSQRTSTLHPELTMHPVMELLDTSQMDDSPSMNMAYGFDSANENEIMGGSFTPINYAGLHMPTSNSYESFPTVSPPEIMSAPPSAVTTSMTTPDFGVDECSPLDFSTDPSPQFFSDDAVLTPDLSIDPSAFFGELPTINGAISKSQAQSSGQSPAPTSPAYPVAPPMSRKCSSGKTSSRDSHDSRHFSTSGISKRKTRAEPLPPIVVEDPNDTVAVKRARNTAAARKSRKRREDHMNTLEAENQKLKEEVEYWKTQALSKHQND